MGAAGVLVLMIGQALLEHWRQSLVIFVVASLSIVLNVHRTTETAVSEKKASNPQF